MSFSVVCAAPSGVDQSDRTPMTMPDGDLLFFSHGYLGDVES